MNIEQLLDKIDTSKMEHIEISSMCEDIGIYDWPEQPSGDERLKYCYYQSWICTDTKVGIRVWYFDDRAVCVSYKPYRKHTEDFYWFSKEYYHGVKTYLESLIVDDDTVYCEIVSDETIKTIFEDIETIEYKRFENKNVK